MGRTVPVGSRAFSYNEGQTWRTNWVMDLSRVPADAIDPGSPHTS